MGQDLVGSVVDRDQVEAVWGCFRADTATRASLQEVHDAVRCVEANTDIHKRAHHEAHLVVNEGPSRHNNVEDAVRCKVALDLQRSTCGGEEGRQRDRERGAKRWIDATRER